jgi:hypothetical protein
VGRKIFDPTTTTSMLRPQYTSPIGRLVRHVHSQHNQFPTSRLISATALSRHTSQLSTLTCLKTKQIVRGAYETSQTVRRRCSSNASLRVEAEPKKTPLFDLHVENGGKMVEFGGHSMPILYHSQSITDSSKWTREKASIFDVSHMSVRSRTPRGYFVYTTNTTARPGPSTSS